MRKKFIELLIFTAGTIFLYICISYLEVNAMRPLNIGEGSRNNVQIIDRAFLRRFADDSMIVVVGVHPDDVEFRLGSIVSRLADINASVHIAILTSGAGDQIQNGKLIREIGIDSATYRRLTNTPGDQAVPLSERVKLRMQEARSGAKMMGLREDAVYFFNFGAGDHHIENFKQTMGDAARHTFVDQCLQWFRLSGKRSIAFIIDGNYIYPHKAHDYADTFCKTAISEVASKLNQSVTILVGSIPQDAGVTHILPVQPGEQDRKRKALQLHASQNTTKLIPIMDTFNQVQRADRLISPFAERYQIVQILPHMVSVHIDSRSTPTSASQI